MFWIFPRLGKVRVSALDSRILVAVPELFGKREIAVVAMLFHFGRALGTVRIVLRNLRHDCCPFGNLRPRATGDSQLSQPLPRLQSLVGFWIPLNDMPKFRHAVLLLAQFD